MTKGWIALDIDGTITIDKYNVPGAVMAYLKNLEKEGWKIAIATGRSFHYATLALSQFDFPYVLICQNGAVALEMPSQNILFKKYLSWDAVAPLSEAYEGVDSDFLIYMGVEKKDLCYFRPHKFPEEARPTIQALQKTQKESWHAVLEFTPELVPSFAVAKGFGPVEEMQIVVNKIESRFHAPLMRNAFGPGGLAMILITDPSASKGYALEEVFRKLGRGNLVIGAGDDENDISMLKVADIGIAMEHAPGALQEHADILAPPTSNMGIIHALQMAIDGKKSR